MRTDPTLEAKSRGKKGAEKRRREQIGAVWPQKDSRNSSEEARTAVGEGVGGRA